MSLLVNCQSLSKAYGQRVLFENLFLSIAEGDHLGLIGPNGSGKSTLLKILAGLESPDQGSVVAKKGLKISYVPQNQEFMDLPLDFLLISSQDEKLADYQKKHLAELWLSKCGFTDFSRSALQLSGGWKKRLSIALALASGPDLLLLDEPTNHLDLEGVLWLEEFLKREVASYIVVSHDRLFLQKATSRIVELNRGFPDGLFSIDGPYETFLEKKELFLEGEMERERSLSSKARREEEWLKASPKARTTKSRARIEDAEELMRELALLKRRNRQKVSEIGFSASKRETHKLVVAKNIAKSVGGKPLFGHLDLTLSPGTRLGLIGANGTGKTTLLKLLAGTLEPDMGTIKRADDLEIVTFDQHRKLLDDHLTLKEALSPSGDYVDFRGQKIHVNGWCKRFLFTPDLLSMPIGRLSGGEKARLQIAHLMLKRADLLLLDEPTNDLDIPTLEILEESLLDFPGAVVLITHDRAMMEKICNLLLVLGALKPLSFADYKQWESSRREEKEERPVKEVVRRETPSQKLSYNEKRELDQIQGRIIASEKELEHLKELLMSPERADFIEICRKAAEREGEIERLYRRWQELESKI